MQKNIAYLLINSLIYLFMRKLFFIKQYFFVKI